VAGSLGFDAASDEEFDASLESAASPAAGDVLAGGAGVAAGVPEGELVVAEESAAGCEAAGEVAAGAAGVVADGVADGVVAGVVDGVVAGVVDGVVAGGVVSVGSESWAVAGGLLGLRCSQVGKL
jgi:hypothetical protein